jgi:hypothetical protein
MASALSTSLVNNREAGSPLVSSLTNFVNMLLSGQCYDDIIPIFFGGNLITLEKKSGGVRPIAIGYTLRRLAAKCANFFALASLGPRPLPEQLGLGTPGGCEAAVHATRRFISDMPPSHVIAKLDFSNAFNNLHRDVMLFAVVLESLWVCAICEPHPCVCGQLVDARGSHALSCKRIAGRLIRQTT